MDHRQREIDLRLVGQPGSNSDVAPTVRWVRILALRHATNKIKSLCELMAFTACVPMTQQAVVQLSDGKIVL